MALVQLVLNWDCCTFGIWFLLNFVHSVRGIQEVMFQFNQFQSTYEKRSDSKNNTFVNIFVIKEYKLLQFSLTALEK